MYFVIGADIVPTDSNMQLFVQRDMKTLIGDELISILKNAEYRIFNLETPLTDVAQPIIKHGPNLITPTAAVEGFKELGIDLLTIANNHIMDQGECGLFSTIQTLDRAEINYVGAGRNIREACRPFTFRFNGKDIGIYACTEHEFSVADDNRPGANPFDPLWSLDHVEELHKSVDYVIILYHGGKEHYRYPSPMLQKTCHRLVDKGADLVLCQHSHCIGCEEKYRDGTIVYGQGNFIFDNDDNDCWKTSLLLKMDDSMRITYLPLVKTGDGVRMADVQSGNEITEAFRSRSNEILRPDFIQEQYKVFADSFGEYYLRAFLGNRSLFSRAVNKLTKGKYIQHLYKTVYTKKAKIRLLNYFDCEAHRELVTRYLQECDE